MEDKKITKKPHVLVFPFPAQGHINPLLQFAKRLVSKGVKTTLVTTIYLSKSMHGDQHGPIAVETVSDGFDHGGYGAAKSPEEYLSKFHDAGSRDLAALIKKLEDIGNSVDVIVYDAFMPWALDVGKQLGLIGAAFFTQSCTVCYIYRHVHEKLLPLPISTTTVVSIRGLPELKASEMPSFVYIYGSFPGFYDMVVGQFSNIDQADWVFFNIFNKLEDEVLNLMAKLWRVRTIGPTIPSMYLDKRLEDDKDYGLNLFKPNFDECMSWLNKKPKASVVYVSFGSNAELGAKQFEEMAYGLQNSGYNFLWVVRNTEQEKLPRMFIDKVDKETGLIVTWSPQLEVLAHDATGCFVTHCGFNSVLEAISLGVPMVTMPQWTDQTTNAKYVEDIWCVGLRTKQDDDGIVRRENLEMCIRELMEGEKGK